MTVQYFLVHFTHGLRCHLSNSLVPVNVITISNHNVWRQGETPLEQAFARYHREIKWITTGPHHQLATTGTGVGQNSKTLR